MTLNVELSDELIILYMTRPNLHLFIIDVGQQRVFLSPSISCDLSTNG